MLLAKDIRLKVRKNIFWEIVEEHNLNVVYSKRDKFLQRDILFLGQIDKVIFECDHRIKHYFDVRGSSYEEVV